MPRYFSHTEVLIIKVYCKKVLLIPPNPNVIVHTHVQYHTMNISYVYVRTYVYIHVGQPVAWCLSDHESSEIIQAFLSSIKAKSPSTCVKVMMTDDGTDNI